MTRQTKNVTIRYVNFTDINGDYPDDEFSLGLFITYCSYFLANQVRTFTPFDTIIKEDPAIYTLSPISPMVFLNIVDMGADFTLFIHKGKLPFPAQDQFRLGFAIVEYVQYQLPRSITDTKHIYQLERRFKWLYTDEISHEYGHQVILWLYPNDVAKSIDVIHNKATATYYDASLVEVPLSKAFNDDGSLNFSYEGLVYPIT